LGELKPDAAKAARITLLAHAKTRFAGDDAAIRKAGSGFWSVMLGHGKDLMSAEERTAWAKALRSAYTADLQIAAALKAEDIAAVVRMVRELDEKQGPAFAKDVFANKELWTKADTGNLLSLAKWLAAVDKDGLKGHLPDLDAELLKRHEIQPLSWQTCADMAWLWVLEGNDKEKAAPWATKVPEIALGADAAKESMDAIGVVQIAGLLHELMLPGKGKDVPGYAEVIARLGKAGKLEAIGDDWWSHYMIGRRLGTAGSREALRAVLLTEEQVPRPVIARILSFSYIDRRIQF
jgi:hypothetical protein